MILMGSLFLVGGLIIGGQKYYDLQKTKQQALLNETVNQTNTQPASQSDNRHIQQAVNEYLERNKQSSIDYITALYADRVDYYSSGLVDKNFIINDKRAYFSKWPERNTTLSSEINVTTGTDAKTWIAAFNIHYQVSNTQKARQGEAWSRLIFKEEGNSLIIVSEKGGIYKPSQVSSLGIGADDRKLTNSSTSSLGSERLLSRDDLVNFSKLELKMLRNEIYARHGYIFKTKDMVDYFSSQNWYQPRYTDVSAMLSDIELSNIKLIKSMER